MCGEVLGEVGNLVVDVLKEGHGSPSTLLFYGGVLDALEFEGRGSSSSEGVDADEVGVDATFIQF